MPKIYISAPLIKNVFNNSNFTSNISISHSIKNKGTSFALEAQFFPLVVSL
jgi:hypothetical protein